MTVGSSPKSLNTFACHVLAREVPLAIDSRSFLRRYVWLPSRHNLDTNFKRGRWQHTRAFLPGSADGQWCFNLSSRVLRE
ncbi:unnamed protein product [Scytosiphon promiscuus]